MSNSKQNLSLLKDLQLESIDFSVNPLDSLSEKEINFIRKRSLLRELLKIKETARYDLLSQKQLSDFNDNLSKETKITLNKNSDFSETEVREIISETLKKLAEWWEGLGLENYKNSLDNKKKEKFVLTDKNREQVKQEVENYENWFEWMENNYKSVSYNNFIEIQKHESQIDILKNKENLSQDEIVELQELEIQLQLFLKTNSNEHSTLKKIIDVYESSKRLITKKGLNFTEWLSKLHSRHSS